MKFQSVNELHLFSFKDCVLERFEILGSVIRLSVNSLIVLPANSQNTNFTKSYAGPSTIRLLNASLLSVSKDGYRYFDANGTLLKELPDTPLSDAEISELLSRLTACNLSEVIPDHSNAHTPPVCEIGIEFPPENPYDTLPTDSYRLRIRFDRAIVEWDFYMNRVQE